jgi:hypothetical protein
VGGFARMGFAVGELAWIRYCSGWVLTSPSTTPFWASLGQSLRRG